MTFFRSLRAAFLLLVAMTLLTGLIYPLAMTGAAQAFGDRTDGSPMRDGSGRVVGSVLLGQQTTDPRWFHARPAAIDDPGALSGGSNLSPTDAGQREEIAKRRAALIKANPQAVGPVPNDAVTASSSGLDPHISVEYATWQAPRIAAARRVATERVVALITAHEQSGLLGLGTPIVNANELNQALERLS